MVGVNAPTAATKWSGPGKAVNTTALAGVQVTTSGQSLRAALASDTTLARRPTAKAWSTRACALVALREATHTSRTPRPSANASRCARPCTPAPTINSRPLATAA